MHLLGPLLLLLEYLAFSDSNSWKVEHPNTLYTWKGACLWIPCSFTIPRIKKSLDNLTLYHNYEYDNITKNFRGTILYDHPKAGGGRVQYVGDSKRNTGTTYKQNCSLSINPVKEGSGWLGLRMTSGTDKWMEKMNLNVSEMPLSPHIQLPPEIQESEKVTLTCSLNFACPGYPIQLKWSLEEPNITQTTQTTLTTMAISTQSQLMFQAQWTHHRMNLTCQLWNNTDGWILSEEMVQLDVKHSPKGVTTVIQNPTPIQEGQAVTLSCKYNSSNPAVNRYEWSPRVSRDEPPSGVLMIPKVAWNAQPIACAACNRWCTWAASVNLDVQYAPRDVRVLQISPHLEIHSGHRVLLRCDFSSSRPKEVRFFWKKNGSLLEEGRELSFASISPEDAGDYSCSVSNSIGQTTSEARRLHVLYAPRELRVSIAPRAGVVEGEKAALVCQSDANPPVFRYTWFDWNNQDLHHSAQTLRLEPVQIQHSGAYRCQATNQLGTGDSAPSTLTVYYSPETIGRRAAVGIGICLAILILAIWGAKLRRSWKRIRDQQGLQENSSGQSFFVRNKKIRRTPLTDGPHALGCHNPVMEDGVSYAVLNFPVGSTDTAGAGGAGTAASFPNRDDTVTYSVVQKRHVGDYENVTPEFPDDEGIHYSELIQFGAGTRPLIQEEVDYATLKH
ncbi:B-cell receptor CD22 isoform X2 [Choloepus didactylus]|uniref:B-cell receptor CD22 isoform X2 n=1 Tax=Choloepus didactylus TaxID=27675 RepID=UPI00189F6D02|nr:B-cell receptor CD22 isoform X2 [Choloepus didactylus]